VAAVAGRRLRDLSGEAPPRVRCRGSSLSDIIATAPGVSVTSRLFFHRPGESQNEIDVALIVGCLRRNPDDAPDTDFRGWRFCLDKLGQLKGNYIQAETVKAFLLSTEYQQRFGP